MDAFTLEWTYYGFQVVWCVLHLWCMFLERLNVHCTRYMVYSVHSIRGNNDATFNKWSLFISFFSLQQPVFKSCKSRQPTEIKIVNRQLSIVCSYLRYLLLVYWFLHLMPSSQYAKHSFDIVLWNVHMQKLHILLNSNQFLAPNAQKHWIISINGIHSGL